MNPTEIMFAAKDLGIKLSVPKDDDRIRCEPKSKLTPELLEEIKANKEALLFDVMMSNALSYMADRYVEGADLSVLHEPEDKINAAYGCRDFEAFRAAIREYVEAANASFQKTITRR